MGHPLYTQPRSAQVWNAAVVGANGQSATFDTFNSPFVSALGHASAATTITLMVSPDGVTWYAGPTQVLAGAADFCLNATVGAEYVALQSLSAATITAYIGAK
jgi:hypothetical protein